MDLGNKKYNHWSKLGRLNIAKKELVNWRKGLKAWPRIQERERDGNTRLTWEKGENNRGNILKDSGLVFFWFEDKKLIIRKAHNKTQK